jgi:CHAD domain-containing protein
MTAPPLLPTADVLELTLAADALSRLRRHPLLAALTQGRPRRVRERAIYFDTPELDLARADLALSVRRVGRVAVQTVSRLGGAHANEPAPVDTVLASDAPDLARIPDPALRAQVAARVAGRPLAPAFEVELARETRLLREDGNEIGFALESGELRTARGPVTLCTLALSARSGDPGYPAQFALELLEVLPLRPSAGHPAERARGVLLGDGARPRKAEAVEVAEGATLEDLVVAVISGCLRQISENEAAAALGVDPEGVHQLRVGVRRLRSALAFFGPVLPERQRAALREPLAWLGAALGPARDLDVFAAEWLAPALAARAEDTALARIDDEVRALRTANYEQVREALRSDRFPRMVLEIRRWLARSAWRDQPLSAESAALFLPARDHASLRLERRHKKARKQARDVATATPESRHQLRIQLKKLRYAAEFSASLFPGRKAQRYARRLGALQDALGVANDAAIADRIAGEVVERIGASPDRERAAGFLAGWSAHAADREVAAIPALWKRFEDVGRFWPKR